MSMFIELTRWAYPGVDGPLVAVSVDHIATIHPDPGHPAAGQKPLGTVIRLGVTALAVHVTEPYDRVMETISKYRTVVEDV